MPYLPLIVYITRVLPPYHGVFWEIRLRLKLIIFTIRVYFARRDGHINAISSYEIIGP